MRLTDLTVQTQTGSSLRRELLRWRDLIAAQYISPEPSLAAHREAFRVLLQFTPVPAAQIPYVGL